jgi:hypothetical protein
MLTACAKNATEQSTSSTTAAPTDAATIQAQAATPGPGDGPIYPGAAENTAQRATTSLNGPTLTQQTYETRDDVKRVVAWYETHAPASWKRNVVRMQGRMIGTFSGRSPAGDRTILVGDDGAGTTRIQVTTKQRP